MKRKHLCIVALILVLLSTLLLFKNLSVSSDIIINKLPKDIPMPTLYYSNISGNKILPYRLHRNKLSSNGQKMIAFTEGILSKNKYTFYMNLIREFTTSQGTNLPTVFHDYYEDANIVVISFSGDLSDIYIIDKASLRVQTLNYNEALNIGSMYVSYIQIVDNHLIILAGEKESYNALIYDVYLPTLEVVDATRLSTHTSAIQDTHYTLTTSGACVFINGTSLKIYDTLEDTYTLLPLDYTATSVISYQDGFIALGHSGETLYYTIFNTDNISISSGTFNLPTVTSLIVDILTTEEYIYIISFDPDYRRYANYVTIYDFQTDSLVYSLGIKSHLPYALLHADFD